MTRTPRWLALLAIASVSVLMLRSPYVAPRVEACMAGPYAPLFLPILGPEDPAAFANGSLGVVHGTFRVGYLIAAYRHLSGAPLQDVERAAIAGPPRAEEAPTEAESALEHWQRVRKRVVTTGPANITPDAVRQDVNEYAYILNCPEDAFRTAARTLEARIQTNGATSPLVQQWVRAQDQVFANCNRLKPSEATVPEELPASAPALARADRDYQRAAAAFYAGQWQDARIRFLAIADTSGSPWRTWGRYLAARTSLREAVLSGAQPDQTKLAQAERELLAVAADPSLAERRAAAQALARLAARRLRPEASLVEMAGALVRPSPALPFARALVDYRYLFANVPSDVFHRDVVRADDLTDWVLTLRGGDASLEHPSLAPPTKGQPNGAARHAYERWKATGSAPWLTAAIALVDPGNPTESELLAAAARIPATSPAAPTLVFHRLRLLLHQGQLDAVRTLLADALAQASAQPASYGNHLRAVQMIVARSFDELLTASVRPSVGSTLASTRWDSIDEGASKESSELQLTDDGIDRLNERLPLSLLQRATVHQAIPARVRPVIVRAVFTRALLLDDVTVLRATAPSFLALYPDLRSPVERILAAAPQVRRDEGALFLLFRPGLRPFVVRGESRRTDARPETPNGPGKDVEEPLTAIDSMRDNWWCGMAPGGDEPRVAAPYEVGGYQREEHRLDRITAQLYENPKEVPWPAFLTQAERTQTEAEWKALDAIDAAPNHLGRIVVAWARAHPDDPRVPEALHRVVRATRYGCTTESTGSVSRAAFTLLRSRYATSEWAKKTPYWFQ